MGCILTHGDPWGHVPSASRAPSRSELEPVPPHSYTSPRLCREFDAGARTMYPLNYRRIYVLTNVTAWVEARWGGHVHRTSNITLYLNEAGKRPWGWTGRQYRHR